MTTSPSSASTPTPTSQEVRYERLPAGALRQDCGTVPGHAFFSFTSCTLTRSQYLPSRSETDLARTKLGWEINRGDLGADLEEANQR